MKKHTIIAIDGPSGSGKSSAAAGLAQGLGFSFINSGSVYRALALKSIRNAVPLDDENGVTELARNTSFEMRKSDTHWLLVMDGTDVSGEIKDTVIAQASSKISVFPGLRNRVNDVLHGMITRNTVVEGRDIGTVVFPQADLKFFITASPEVRAMRRYEELRPASPDITYEQMLNEIELRDLRDRNRETAPLKPAGDALIVDTTKQSLQEVIAFLYNETKARLSQRYIDTVNDIRFYTTISAGFCFGVKRAVDIAIKTSRQHNDIFTLGPLIHNPQEVRRLEELGIKPVDDIGSITSGTLVYRSHGVTTEEARHAGEKGLHIIDATCPFVTRSQRLVRTLSKKGYHVVIVGDAKHPEVRSLLSYALPHQVTVVKSPEELPPFWNTKKLAVLAQTTQSMENFKKIVSVLLDSVYELAIFNTICDATKIRQDESATLARMVDVMVVIGGFNSSNTNKLANICKAINPNTYHVEHEDQLRREMLIRAKKVGITAGASTPIWLVKNVLKRLKELSKELQ